MARLRGHLILLKTYFCHTKHSNVCESQSFVTITSRIRTHPGFVPSSEPDCLCLLPVTYAPERKFFFFADIFERTHQQRQQVSAGMTCKKCMNISLLGFIFLLWLKHTIQSCNNTAYIFKFK